MSNIVQSMESLLQMRDLQCCTAIVQYLNSITADDEHLKSFIVTNCTVDQLYAIWNNAPIVKAPPVESTSTGCKFVITRGANKGNHCGKKTVDGKDCCKTHIKHASDLAVVTENCIIPPVVENIAIVAEQEQTPKPILKKNKHILFDSDTASDTEQKPVVPKRKKTQLKKKRKQIAEEAENSTTEEQPVVSTSSASGENAYPILVYKRAMYSSDCSRFVDPISNFVFNTYIDSTAHNTTDMSLHTYAIQAEIPLKSIKVCGILRAPQYSDICALTEAEVNECKIMHLQHIEKIDTRVLQDMMSQIMLH